MNNRSEASTISFGNGELSVYDESRHHLSGATSEDAGLSSGEAVSIFLADGLDFSHKAFGHIGAGKSEVVGISGIVELMLKGVVENLPVCVGKVQVGNRWAGWGALWETVLKAAELCEERMVRWGEKGELLKNRFGMGGQCHVEETMNVQSDDPALTDVVLSVGKDRASGDKAVGTGRRRKLVEIIF